MSEQKSTTPKILLFLVAALVVGLGVQGWYMAGMYKKLIQIQADNPGSAWSVDPGNPPAKRLPGNRQNQTPLAPLDDDWFNRPLDSDNWDPFQEMQQMQDHMNRMFGDAFGRFNQSSRFGGLYGSGSFTPSIDIKEEEDRFVIHVDLPGAQKNNVNVKLEDRQLTITGKLDQQKNSGSGKDKVLRRERRSGKFSRTITLPAPVRAGEMESRFKKGVLEITIPKA